MPIESNQNSCRHMQRRRENENKCRINHVNVYQSAYVAIVKLEIISTVEYNQQW